MQHQPLTVLKKRQQLWLKSFPKIEVLTNQYETRLNSNLQYFRVFQIHSEPELEVDSYEIHRQAMRQCPQSIKKTLDCDYFAKRGYTLWYLTKNQLTKQKETKLKFSPPTYVIQVDKFEYKIILKYIKQSHITEKDSMALVSQFMNIKFKQMIIRDCKMKQMARNVFFPKWSAHFYDDKFQIEARIGFKFSLQFLEIQLYCDVNNRIKQLNRKSFLDVLFQKRNSLEHYKGKKVKKMYGNYDCFEIQQIVTSMSPQSTFMKNGKKITYATYYQQAYNLYVKETNQPLLKALSRQLIRFRKQGRKNQIQQEIIYLIPEFVALAEISEAAKNAARKELFLTPNQCIEKADKFIKQVNSNQKQFTIYAQNRSGYAHLLPQPKIQINKFTEIEPRDGVFRVESEIYETISLDDVLIVYSVGKDAKFDRKQIDENVKNLNKGGQRYNISISNEPGCLEIKDNSGPQEWVRQVEKDMKENSKPNLVIFALMEHQMDYYPYIKEQLTYRLDIESQVFLRQKVINKQKGYLKIAGNIMKQIAAKKNKTLWKMKETPKFEEKLVLIIGISIQKYESKFELIFSRSFNKEISKFKTKSFIIDSKEIPNLILQQQFYSSLEEYIKYEKKKYKPSTIVVYRMGLNNEKFAQEHLKNESAILKERVEYICKSKFKKEVYEPEIVYIQIFDRPSQKIWIQEEGHQQGTFLPRVINPQVGTVMRGAEDNEFYLVSYGTRFGAVQPTLFRVVKNESKVPIQFITQFTFAQSYMYFNWEGSVRLPQILQLCKKAHKYVKPKGEYQTHVFETPGFM